MPHQNIRTPITKMYTGIWHHDQVGFILGMPDRCHSGKSAGIIHLIHSLKMQNHTIILKDTEK